MSSPTDVQTSILTGQLKVANMVLSNISALQAGALKVDWWNAIKGTRSILAASNLYQLGDFSSSIFQTAYSCLRRFVGIYPCGAIDPNAQNPGFNIINNPITANYKEDIIPFTNQTTVGIYNYNTTLALLYGPNPGVFIYQAGFTEDEQTPPTYTYQTANDPTSPLLSIVWNFAFPTTGYIKIWGSVPVSVNGNGSNGPIPAFEYTDANLLQDANGIWYLPLTLPVTLRPYYVEVNGNQLQATYERTSGRLYGFANNNSPQTILVSIQ